jgi:tripartite-type tricarboxylate transporter receptor subunit TctC
MRFLAMPSIVVAGLLTIPMVSPLAAPQWPSRAVRLVVPYPAGGNVDSAARIVGNRLQEVLGRPFIVDNKSGAGADRWRSLREVRAGRLHVIRRFQRAGAIRARDSQARRL